MFGGGAAGKKRVRELEEALARAEKQTQEANSRAKDAAERAQRAEDDLRAANAAAAAELQTATEKERARALEWETEYNNLRAQYETGASAWNERFSAMEATDAQRASTEAEMAQELGDLKLQLKQVEEGEDARQALEASVASLQETLAASQKRVSELEEAAKIAAQKAKAKTQPALEKANTSRAITSPTIAKKSRRAGSVDSPLGLGTTPAVGEIGGPLDEYENAATSPGGSRRKTARRTSRRASPRSSRAEKRPSRASQRGPTSPKSASAVEHKLVASATAPVVSPSPPVVSEFPTLAEIMSPKRSPLKVDTSDEARGLRTEVAVLRAKLGDREKEVADLQARLDEKLHELVAQGEKSYKLYDKLEALKALGDQSREELAAVRTLLLQEIAGEGVDVTRFAHVSVQDLVRLSRAQNFPAEATTLDAEDGDQALPGAEMRKEEGAEGVDDAAGADEIRAERAAAAASANSDTISRLQIELQVLRQNNKRLTSKVEAMESIERTGQAAIESMDTMKRRTDDLVRRLRLEKDLRGKTLGELDKANERIQALSKHIEKVMIHLKHEAAAKNIALTEVKNYKKEATVLRQRNAALQKKTKSRERVMQELKEGTRILEDQLRLMDEKYVQLRTKLDWTRTTSNRETKRIQQEANKLRASFALAFSQVGSLDGASLNLSMLSGAKMDQGFIHGPGSNNPDSDDDEDDDDSVDEDDEDDDGEAAAERADGEEDDAEAQRLEDAGGRKAGKKEAKFPDIEVAPRSGGELLPAIESILPSSERYAKR